ncbi:MAG: CHAD domain-containing protein [Nitrosomonadales bacterium]|nr:CHAD domain-containing protein [Nitrosomonadales bacterium]
MSFEAELKLRIVPEHLDRLKRHPLLKKLSGVRGTTRKLYSVYYDTPDLELRQRAMTLRLRHIGKQWVQTLKTGGRVQAGLHQRNKWEAPVDGEALDLNALKASDDQHLSLAVRKKLQPVFVTEFSRTTRMVTFGGAEIELSLDSGEIRAGRKSRPISELELELKSGESAQLFKLALALLDIVPLEVEYTSQAEYGYLLHSVAQPAVGKASFPSLAKSTGVASALQSMVGSCLLHLQANISGAIKKLDEEYLHQVRVALRRLRVVLSVAEKFRADDELSKLHEQVAELCVELGRLREWDVFVTQILAPMRARLPEQDGLRLFRTSEKLRGQYQAAVGSRLQSQDYQRFLLRFGAWMHGGYWHEPAADGLTLPLFAAQILDKRSRQVGKRGKHLATADTSQLHMLRTACKKLRYSAEMFTSLFDPVKAEHNLSALTTLQDILGTLNDIAVAHRLLDELDAGTQHESTILIRGWIERDYLDQIVKLNKAWEIFSGQKAFWHQVAR